MSMVNGLSGNRMERLDWWPFIGGALFGIGGGVPIWPEMTIFSLAKVPPIILDFPLRVLFTIILAFFGGLSGMLAKDIYTYLKKKYKK
jgi:CDP-diglyceride synthetase